MLGPGNTLVLGFARLDAVGSGLDHSIHGRTGGHRGYAAMAVYPNEVQKLSFSKAPSSGNFKIKVVRPDGSAVTTGSINIDSNQNNTATNIANALNSGSVLGANP